ncbi:MAG: rRNA cytosine-C5-methyltransferase [Flavobacteriales bacterium]|nr:rRNA cytosine-C5-methyltransferase [Flavobacteriales bacterium]
MNFPEDFKTYCRNHFSDSEELLDTLNTVSPTSIRINSSKIKSLDLTPVNWNDKGYYLEQRPVFTEDPLFHAGSYYVQEASSMLIGAVQQIVDCSELIQILDLCAAPGGKSTLLLDLFPNALLVANEIISKRAKILAENITKWGTERAIITNATPEQISRSGTLYDIILVDAPCSGEGMFRKDLNAREVWSKENVNLCTLRQQDIITTIEQNLKRNGILIYSTCTFNLEENEKNVSYFINELGLEEVKVDVPEEIEPSEFGYRMWPHKIKGEGFYVAFLKKTTDSTFNKRKIKSNRSLIPSSQDEFNLLKKTFTNIHKKDLLKYEEDHYWFDQAYHSTLMSLQDGLRIVQFGQKLGKIVHNKLIPDETVHFHAGLKNTFESIEVTQEEAVKFLKKEEINVGKTGQGYFFITFRSVPIGMVKLIGNRANNYFPKEWRIINPNIGHSFSIANFEKD